MEECHLCGRKFSSREELAEHMMEEHSCNLKIL